MFYTRQNRGVYWQAFVSVRPLLKVSQGVKLWKCCVPHCVAVWCLWICSACKTCVI